MASLSSSLTYPSGYSVAFSPVNGIRHRSLSFLSASPKGLKADELCVRFQRKSGRTSVFMQDGAIVTNSDSTESSSSKSSLKGLKEEVLSVLSQEADKVGSESDGQNQSTVSITVVGTSGDLAKKKIFPALFALYYEDCLPEGFDEYMNLVLDEAEEVSLKKINRKPLGEFTKKQKSPTNNLYF
ncbi:hypothetical protein Rs2_32449 [Raphanus sativus]|uniref:Glucose-6-phosphate 1-dehydrogenase 2, chloroplastic-like n=1 Tax=Raphanus sativus TaxID=3726 RepID=A0A6J0KAB1_RAPSA|nr:glucose-6-phosphate 1-dehydrogenase 2, chloroplastic-like [Raphanus sativus]XP_018444513.1 glucose-6-phosphate 1-dehydrogenase 2, chloroplastic-like [Raphanus sativus]KAJ4882356.1 hypothetical protein Rs2_32449 [Raphanus sativus]